ncbi:33246_t:CDS:2, partial [Racocetra persica]
TDISNTGQTSIHATIESTKVFYQFLTGESPQYWITSSTLARWNLEIVTLSFNQNHPKEASSKFFSYDDNKIKPIITVVKVTDIACCNTETVSNIVFKTCKEKGIDPQKCYFWLTDNMAYMSSELNGMIAKFNSLATSQFF